MEQDHIIKEGKCAPPFLRAVFTCGDLFSFAAREPAEEEEAAGYQVGASNRDRNY
ncbi:hypothetical protein TRIUR3_06351 [Triticum urartu]|uniref:Uncharacterized protein n=1 Tax=Triticum urartu TaxID=4572 RepID=M8A000_TRIUA|nr:hypothetical protein TRIUR3_06351 [Triticum urartu]